MEALGLSALVVAFLAIAGFITLWVLSLRTIVPPNKRHIITQGKKVISYGKDTSLGNVYYEWPAFLPVIGMSVQVLPVSNFELELDAYEGYDIDKVPFVVDIVAFYRILDATEAAMKAESYTTLKHQLSEILSGAVRKVLATYKLEDIMLKRSELGASFTEEVGGQLEKWGVESVKPIELMDIRDAEGETNVFNIMEKKRSFIQMESRVEVADNMQKAESAEITARQTVQIKDQDAIQKVGQRTAEQTQAVGIANEEAKQEIKSQEKVTKEREMDVLQVQEVKNQEIIREKNVVKADEDRQTAVINADGAKQKAVIDAEANKEQAVIRAEGEKTQTVLVSEGVLAEQQNNAKGIEAVGLAEGKAEEAILMAPVTAQLALAKEVGENDNYQAYLQNIENIGAYKAVGVASADALVSAETKIIVNAGDVQSGLTNVMDLFSTKGGTNIGGMIEAASQVPGGKALLDKLGVDTEANDTVTAVTEALANTGNVNNDTPRSSVKKKASK